MTDSAELATPDLAWWVRIISKTPNASGHGSMLLASPWIGPMTDDDIKNYRWSMMRSGSRAMRCAGCGAEVWHHVSRVESLPVSIEITVRHLAVGVDPYATEGDNDGHGHEVG